jgi:hypothetical protein
VTAAVLEAAAPPEARTRHRDLALDVLRGWAISIMIIGHVGPMTRLTMLTHFPVWLSASDPFFFISGTVLGMRGRALLERGRRGEFYVSLWRRAGQLWLVHVLLMLAVLGIHETTGRLDVLPTSAFGGWSKSVLWILLLRFQSADFMNILPLYVVFLAIAPLGFEAMRRRVSWPWFSFAFTGWVLALRDPNFLRLADPRVEQVFSAPAWHFAFVLGSLLGFYSREAAQGWQRVRRWALPLLLTSSALLFVLAQFQRKSFLAFGLALPAHWEWLVAKETWGPLRVVYALGLILLLYLAAGWLLARPASTPLALLGRRALEPLLLMGQKSLFCFVSHLFFALLAAAFALSARPGWQQELATALSVLAVYGLARLDVARVAPARG